MDNNSYISTSQQRLMALIKVLAHHPFTGLTAGELANSLKVNPSAITRDMANLSHAGWASEADGRWTLSPAFGQLSVHILRSLEKTKDKATELLKRHTTER